jgi:hypothetical protein
VDTKDHHLALAPAVKRVTDLFDHPKFFSDRPGEHDIHQGKIGDCWFLSALSTVATYKELMEKICVAVRSYKLLKIGPHGRCHLER